MKEVLVRKNGVFAGVCGGLAEQLGISAPILRLLVFVSLFFTLGFTLLLYIAAVFSFPTEASLPYSETPKFLGVCAKLAPQLEMHPAWLRFLTLVIWIFTAFFPVFVAYLVVYLVQTATDDVNKPDKSNMRDVN